MKVIQEFREYFDGTRELKENAARLAAEAERRGEVREMTAKVGALAASPVVIEYRETVLGLAGSAYPSELMTAGEAFFYRKGLECAIAMLDELIASAESENA